MNIESSFVDIKKIHGRQHVGGLIGNADSAGSVNISKSYVWIDKNGDQNPGENDIHASLGSNEAVASFVGNAGNIAVGFLQMEKSYADVINATVDDSKFKSIVSEGGAVVNTSNININNVVSIGLNSGYNGQVSGVFYYNSHQEMIDNVGDFEYGDGGSDWALNPSGNLVLGWQEHGFHNN